MLLLYYLCVFLAHPFLIGAELQFENPFNIKRPCETCRNVANSFNRAFEITAHQSFEGGDTDWEEKNLGSYKSSEVRFIEMEEYLCVDVNKGRTECYAFAEKHELNLIEWFFMHRKKDLLTYLCIDTLKVCCPDNMYGPDCKPCPGGVKDPCFGHGKCKNAGTREETSGCICDIGYSGELCNTCDKGYYKALDSSTFLCKKCDNSCKGHCRGPGPKNCEACLDGYYFVSDEGCVVKPNASDIAENEEPTSEVHLMDTTVKSNDREEL